MPGTDFRMWSPAGTEPGPDTAIGGRSVITDAFPAEMPSYFLNYFAVADCDATAEAGVHLGGRVSVPPSRSRTGGWRSCTTIRVPSSPYFSPRCPDRGQSDM